ncbi:Mut7-C RNAse domain-containing protein [Thalassiella azotivora]
MSGDVLVVRVEDALRHLLTARHRRLDVVAVAPDPTSTVGHLVEALGVPLTEVGDLLLDGEPVPPSGRTDAPGTLLVRARARPQRAPTDPPRFLLDVHLGSLARRLRLLGLDVAYRNPADDDELVAQAARERRVLLTKDRGLLRRRALQHGAFVRGQGVEEEAADVLDRFDPPLAPWTRCPACGRVLRPASLEEVSAEVPPGTRRTYTEFARCTGCGRVLWRGAHAAALEAAVRRAQAPGRWR